MRIGVIGTGAIGGYYGAKLQVSGQDLHFLVNRDAAVVQAQGLTVSDGGGEIRLPQVQVYTRATDMPVCDLVLVGLKTTHNHRLAELLPPVVRTGQTVVALLQNGLGVEEEVRPWCAGASLLGGLCFVCAQKTGPGRIRNLGYGRVVFAEYRDDGRPAGETAATRLAAEAFVAAGLDASIQPHLAAARWRKLVWNVPYNGLTTLLATDTAAVMRHTATRRLVERLMREVQTAAIGHGIPIEDTFIQKMLADTGAMAGYEPSMKLDRDRGHPLELPAIYDRPIAAAQRVGVAVPEMVMLRDLLRFMDPQSAGP